MNLGHSSLPYIPENGIPFRHIKYMNPFIPGNTSELHIIIIIPIS